MFHTLLAVHVRRSSNPGSRRIQITWSVL